MIEVRGNADSAGIDAMWSLDGELPGERERVVRLCARLSGDVDAADDLAQETLVEAWRNRSKLRDADGQGRRAWLFAIAQRVCLRWRRSRGRDAAHQVATQHGAEEDEPLERLAGDGDLEQDLEREELAELLDRALALLPSQTRDVLIARYILETPLGELAARLGLNEGAVAVRLHRGRLALRRVLSSDLRDEAAAYGLSAPQDDGWQETRIWCSECGQHRLLGRYDVERRHLVLRCPGCPSAPDFLYLDHVDHRGLLAGVKTLKPALTRVMDWANTYYRRGLAEGTVRCARCGRPAVLDRGLDPSASAPPRPEPGVHVICSCKPINQTTLQGMALYTPEGQRFWREHSRIFALPQRTVEFGGRSAIVAGYASVADAARLDVLFDRDTYSILHVFSPWEPQLPTPAFPLDS